MEPDAALPSLSTKLGQRQRRWEPSTIIDDHNQIVSLSFIDREP
jgi:hypothetical protein